VRAVLTYGKATGNDDCHLPEDDNHHSHRRGNLKSYNWKWFKTYISRQTAAGIRFIRNVAGKSEEEE
jgi:hypothetical protein